jgi:hypothetical protein
MSTRFTPPPMPADEALGVFGEVLAAVEGEENT